MKSILLALLLTFPAIAMAHPSVVAVDTEGGKGSATYVGNGLFVTAYHVVDGADHIFVTDSLTKTTYPCSVVAVSQEDDIAILRTPFPVLTPKAKIAPSGVRSGDRVTGWGYGQSYANDKPPYKRRGFKGSVGSRGKIHSSATDNCYSFDSPAIPGDSGGGVFNSRGELVGPLFGTDGSNCYATMNSELHKLMGVLSR